MRQLSESDKRDLERYRLHICAALSENLYANEKINGLYNPSIFNNLLDIYLKEPFKFIEKSDISVENVEKFVELSIEVISKI